MNSNLKLEKKILNLSFIGSVSFLIAEIIAAIWTGSAAVLMDCVFDIADLIMIGPFMVLIPLLYKPETEKKPYGFSQVESLFILIKCGILMCVTVFLIIDSIKTILDGGNHVDASIVAIYELAVSASCVVMYLVLRRINKKFSSPSIKAEIYIWKLDSLSTLGVGIGFLGKVILDYLGYTAIGPYVDPGIAIIVAVLLLKEPIGLFIEALKNLVLFAPDKDTSEKIRDICNEHLNEHDIFINFLDIIKTGRKLWVQVYFICYNDLVSVTRLKELREEITANLSNEFDSIVVELIPDTDDISESIMDDYIARRPEKINYIDGKERKQQNKKESKKKQS